MCSQNVPRYTRYYLVKRTIDNVFGIICGTFGSYSEADGAYEKIDIKPWELFFYSIEGGW